MEIYIIPIRRSNQFFDEEFFFLVNTYFRLYDNKKKLCKIVWFQILLDTNIRTIWFLIKIN